MIKLLKIELKKVLPNKTFWILMILYVVVLGLVFFGTQGFINKVTSQAGSKSPIPIPEISIYNFSDIWHNLTFIAGFLKIFLAVIVIILITNEFSYKTIRQNILAGMSRWDFLKSKILSILGLAMISTLLIFIMGMILGFIYSSSHAFTDIFRNTVFLLGYFLEVTGFLMFAFLIGFLVKRSGLAIGILLLYYIIIEPIINYKLPDYLDDYLPIRAINNLIDIPNTVLMRLFGVEFQDYIALSDVGLVLGYCCLFCGITYLILVKRDL
jgi:ABC-type transport system involved in multi-copper enzyme maturation permease subunit